MKVYKYPHCSCPLYEEDILKGRCSWCGFEYGREL